MGSQQQEPDRIPYEGYRPPHTTQPIGPPNATSTAVSNEFHAGHAGASQQELFEQSQISDTQKWLGFLWRIVIFCIAVILVGSTVAVIVGVFLGLANITPLVTVFTAALALLGGLLAPSPIQEAIRAIADLRSAQDFKKRADQAEMRITELEKKLQDARFQLEGAEMSSRASHFNIREVEMNAQRQIERAGIEAERHVEQEELKRTKLEASIRGLLSSAHDGTVDAEELGRLIEDIDPATKSHAPDPLVFLSPPKDTHTKDDTDFDES
ncbi:MAG: hypothetical protein NVSMB38_08970 [Ktedonobacteraceae bacterium]